MILKTNCVRGKCSTQCDEPDELQPQEDDQKRLNANHRKREVLQYRSHSPPLTKNSGTQCGSNKQIYPFKGTNIVKGLMYED